MKLLELLKRRRLLSLDEAERPETLDTSEVNNSECDECRITVKLLEKLVEQMDKTHESLCCSECKMLAELMDRLLVHMRREHEKIRLEFQCNVYGLKTDAMENLRSHMEKEHKKEEKTLEKVEKNYEKKLETKKRKARMKADIRMEKKL